jgi:hypothetical protein
MKLGRLLAHFWFKLFNVLFCYHPGGLSPRCLCFIFVLRNIDTWISVNVMMPSICVA